MDSRDIEKIINLSIKRLKDEYELLNTTMLNALHQNIDILINNSERWFGSDVPEAFRGVLNSLMTITYLYYQEKGDLGASVVDPVYEEFRPDVFLNGVITDMESILRINNITVGIQADNATIRTSKKLLRDSLYNIFLSISQFMNDGSSTTIELREESSRVVMAMRFQGLNDHLPDAGKISRVFYSYFDGVDYRINVGLNVALENLRNIGIIVKVRSDQEAGELKIDLSIPTTGFLETIDVIRKSNMAPCSESRGVEIGLCFEDIILEMVIRETLLEHGFTPVRTTINDLLDGKDSRRVLVADGESLARSMMSKGDLRDLTGRVDRLVVIHGADDAVPASESGSIVYIMKPFNVDTVIDLLS